MPWYRGNLHCHSTRSDGNASPTAVAGYYKKLGMDFVALADHNRLTPPADYRDTISSTFIGIPCSEYTGAHHCHVLAVDAQTAVHPDENSDTASAASVLRDGITRTRNAGGVPVLCHPCWKWAYAHTSILALQDVRHFEVFNAARDCNSYPIGATSAPEAIWDQVLSAGVRFYGVGVDDAHWHGSAEEAARSPHHLALGGTGWSVIKAPELSGKAIRAAFESGHFYASTGVDISLYRVTSEGISIGVRPWSQERVLIEFIGCGGTHLDKQFGAQADYRFRGDEIYVRARIADTSGCCALTQPVFLDDIDRDIAWTATD